MVAYVQGCVWENRCLDNDEKFEMSGWLGNENRPEMAFSDFGGLLQLKKWVVGDSIRGMLEVTTNIWYRKNLQQLRLQVWSGVF